MSKGSYKELNNKKFQTDYSSFGENGLIYVFKDYFILFNQSDLNHCWLFIADNFKESLIFSGRCLLNIFRGSVNINGVDFNENFEEKIYSPISHARVTLRSSEVINEKTSITIETFDSILKSENNFNEADKSFLKTFTNENDLVSKIENWNILKLSSLVCLTTNDIVQFKEFKRLFDVDTSFPFAKKLRFSITLKEEGEYCITNEMKETMQAIVQYSLGSSELRVALVGPKNSGKSSFLKTLTNKLLSGGHKEVCIIDGDPGQSEFSTCGSLSLTVVSRPLLGQPFTHQLSQGVSVIEQYFLGVLSPNDDPKLYCRSFERLYQTYLSMSKGRHLALIINTMGWPQGVGLLLLAFKLQLTSPSHILQLKKGKNNQDLMDISPAMLDRVCQNEGNLLVNVKRQFDPEIILIRSPVPTNQRTDLQLNAQNHRDLTILTYLFHETKDRPVCFSGSLPLDYQTNPVTRLRCRVPQSVRFLDNKPGGESDPCPAVQLRLVYSELADNEPLDCLIDCFPLQWVGLCRPADRAHYNSVIAQSSYRHPCRPESDLMLCLGMGLVSHVKKDAGEIYLHTGLDRAHLDGCCLVKGKIYPPESIFLNQREILCKHNNYNLPFISPIINAGIGRTAIPSRKSLPKIRRHHHNN